MLAGEWAPFGTVLRKTAKIIMSLSDYTYLSTLGASCGPTFQLNRAAVCARFKSARIGGPFDWFMVNVPQAIEVLGRNFGEYFMPDALSAKVLDDGYWRVTDTSGVTAWHQLEGKLGEEGPSKNVWFAFGKWLGQRIQIWNDAVQDPAANILFIRAEDPFVPDRPEDVLRLADMLRQQVAGRFTLLWARSTAPLLGFEDPNIRMFQVRPAWPEHLGRNQVDYDRDYGFGVAWRGRDDDWDAVWCSLDHV